MGLSGKGSQNRATTNSKHQPHIKIGKDADSEHCKIRTTHELLSHARMVRVINRASGLSHSGNVFHLCNKDNVIITQCNKKSTTSLTF